MPAFSVDFVTNNAHPAADRGLIPFPRDPSAAVNLPEAYQRLAPALVHMLTQKAGGGHEVGEELAQQTWTLVCQAVQAGRYDPLRAAFSTFVYSVAHKVWLRWRRSMAVQARRGVVSLEDQPLADGNGAVAGALDLAEQIQAVRDCLENPPTALTGHIEVLSGIAAGESDRALARRLGLAASTVNARKKTALEALRNALQLRTSQVPASAPPRQVNNSIESRTRGRNHA